MTFCLRLSDSVPLENLEHNALRVKPLGIESVSFIKLSIEESDLSSSEIGDV